MFGLAFYQGLSRSNAISTPK